MSHPWMIIFTAFVASSCLALFLSLLLPGSADERMAIRLKESLTDQGASTTQTKYTQARILGFKQVLPTLSAPLIPENRNEQIVLQTRLVQAGMYAPNAMKLFLGAKMLLVMGLTLIGLIVWGLGWVDPAVAFLTSAVGGILGLIIPSFWLDSRKKSRQIEMRRALPDGLDMLIICLEGGSSLLSSLQRVTVEIRDAHPLLANEWDLTMRATELGQRPGDALKQCAARFDLEELRRLASVVVESERYGTSIGKSLRLMAQSLRFQRQQRAEELARFAEVKMLFPTVLFILPCVFVVILFPAVILMGHMFHTVNAR